MRPVPEPIDIEAPVRVVRSAIQHDSAVGHVRGSATYVADMREPNGTLHLAVGGAPHAHGRVRRLDLDAVRSAPGVVAVLTARDIPGKNDVSPIMGDDPMFADGTVEFHGQVLFAVAAETRDAARRAARLAKIEIDVEPALITVDEALAAGTRVLPDYTFTKGDVAAALKASERQVAGML